MDDLKQKLIVQSNGRHWTDEEENNHNNDSMKSNAIYTIEEAIESAGSQGVYQYKVLFFLSLQWIVTAFILMAQPFLMAPPKFVCTNSAGHEYLCDEVYGCTAKRISPESEKSFAVQFGLYCDKSWMRSLASSVIFICGSVGCMIFAPISDSYGRKIAMMSGFIFGAIAYAIAAFSNHVWIFIFGQALGWLGIDAYYTMTFVMINEFAGESIRAVASISLNCMYSIGEIVLVCLVYYFREWQTISRYIITVPVLVSCIGFYFMYESPRFLFIKGKWAELKTYLRDVSKQNVNSGRRGSILQYVDQLDSVIKSNEDIRKKKDYPLSSLFKTRSLRKSVISLTIICFYTYLVYNGLIFGLENIGSNVYVNGLVIGGAEIIGYLSAAFLVKRVRRKVMMCTSLILSSSLALGYLYFGTGPVCGEDGGNTCFKSYLESVMAMGVKYFISIMMSLIFVYGAELLPTSVRSTGLGVCVFAGRLGSMIAPSIDQYSKYYGINQMVVYGFVGIFSLVPVYYLEETFGKKLHD